MKVTKSGSKKQTKIEKIGITNDILTGRGGMALFSRYLREIGILGYLAQAFIVLRIRKSGIPVIELLKQIICCFVEGSSRHFACLRMLPSRLYTRDQWRPGL